MLGAKLLSAALIQPSNWDVSTIVATGKTFDFSSQTADAQSLTFKSDGSRMYLKQSTTIYEYALGAQWAIHTAVFDTSHTIPSLPVGGGGHFISPDGLKLYASSVAIVYEYDLSPAWDLSSASLANTFDTSVGIAVFLNLYFDANGDYMFVAPFQASYHDVYKYNLSPAWDVSSATYSSYIQIRTSSPNQEDCAGLAFKSDGRKVITLSDDAGFVELDGPLAYTLSSPWTLPNALVTATERKEVAETGGSTRWSGIAIKPDGKRMYLVGDASNKIYEYSMG